MLRFQLSMRRKKTRGVVQETLNFYSVYSLKSFLGLLITKSKLVAVVGRTCPFLQGTFWVDKNSRLDCEPGLWWCCLPDVEALRCSTRCTWLLVVQLMGWQFLHEWRGRRIKHSGDRCTESNTFLIEVKRKNCCHCLSIISSASLTANRWGSTWSGSGKAESTRVIWKNKLGIYRTRCSLLDDSKRNENILNVILEITFHSSLSQL